MKIFWYFRNVLLWDKDLSRDKSACCQIKKRTTTNIEHIFKNRGRIRLFIDSNTGPITKRFDYTRFRDKNNHLHKFYHNYTGIMTNKQSWKTGVWYTVLSKFRLTHMHTLRYFFYTNITYAMDNIYSFYCNVCVFK